MRSSVFKISKVSTPHCEVSVSFGQRRAEDTWCATLIPPSLPGRSLGHRLRRRVIVKRLLEASAPVGPCRESPIASTHGSPSRLPIYTITVRQRDNIVQRHVTDVAVRSLFRSRAWGAQKPFSHSRRIRAWNRNLLSVLLPRISALYRDGTEKVRSHPEIISG